MLDELYPLELFHELTEVNSHAWVGVGGGIYSGVGAFWAPVEWNVSCILGCRWDLERSRERPIF